MSHFRSEPWRVSLHVGTHDYPAVALALSGQTADVRASHALAPDSDVSVRLDWRDGATTSLSGRVRSVDEAPGRQQVAHVDLVGIGGDWRPFLEYLGGHEPLPLAG